MAAKCFFQFFGIKGMRASEKELSAWHGLGFDEFIGEGEVFGVYQIGEDAELLEEFGGGGILNGKDLFVGKIYGVLAIQHDDDVSVGSSYVFAVYSFGGFLMVKSDNLFP